MISIGDWKGNFHDDYEQVKRIESARTKKMQKSIISVDKESGIMHTYKPGSRLPASKRCR